MTNEYLNPVVTKFLDDLNHPMKTEIQHLRQIILGAHDGLAENIKWNGPNYSYVNEDRITMRIYPPKQIQIIFHRGARKLTQPANKIINDNSGLLMWKENDRAVAAFKNIKEIVDRQKDLTEIVKKWIKATSQQE